MRFNVPIGDKEKHDLSVLLSGFTRKVKVFVDGSQVSEFLAAWSGNKETNTKFKVGTEEKHDVEVKVVSNFFSADMYVLVDGNVAYKT